MDSKSKMAEAQYEQQYHSGSNVPPPPVYSTMGATPPTNNQLPSTYPPQAHHTQSPSRTLQVEKTNLMGCRMRIFDLATSETLYDTKMRSLRMRLEFMKPGRSEAYASVKYHKITPRVDIELPNTPTFTLSFGLFKLHYEVTYPSPSLNQELLTWKSKYHWKTLDLECRDRNGVMVARMKASNWKWKKTCQMELFGGSAICANPRVVDELLVTGLGLIEYIMMSNASSAGAAGGAAAGGAGA